MELLHPTNIYGTLLPMSKENMPANEDKTLYEVGLHLVPTIAEEGSEKEFNTIKKLIETHNGEVVSESKPAFLKLAYTIVKSVDSKNYKYDTAFFGWVKFNATGADILELQSELDLNGNIVRYMILKTTKDANISSEDVADFLNDDDSKKVTDDSEETSEEKEVEVKEEVESADDKAETVDNTDEVDKAIDEMVG